MTTRNPLVRISGKIVDLPASDSIGGAPAGANGTNGINGGAITIGYTFDTTTTDAGNGKLRLNSATQNATTSVYLDLVDSLASDWTTVIDTFDDSTNTVKGSIRIVKSGDASKFLTFNVSAVTTATGYRKLTVANTGSSAASPFANGDAILLCFDRAGDKGADGAGGFALLESHTAANSASLSFTSWYSSTYDEYEIHVVALVPGTAAQTVSLRFSTDGGSTYDSGNNYGWATLESSSSGSGVGGTSGSTNIIGLGRNLTTTASYSMGGVYKLFDPAGANYKKVVGTGSVSTGTGAEVQIANGVYRSTTAVNAFQIFMSSGNIASGTVRVYGVPK